MRADSGQDLNVGACYFCSPFSPSSYPEKKRNDEAFNKWISIDFLICCSTDGDGKVKLDNICSPSWESVVVYLHKQLLLFPFRLSFWVSFSCRFYNDYFALDHLLPVAAPLSICCTFYGDLKAPNVDVGRHRRVKWKKKLPISIAYARDAPACQVIYISGSFFFFLHNLQWALGDCWMGRSSRENLIDKHCRMFRVCVTFSFRWNQG